MGRRNHEKDHKVSAAVMKRAEEIYRETYDAYVREVEQNVRMERKGRFNKMGAVADKLGVSEQTILNANNAPLSTSGWVVLIMMALIEEEKRTKAAYETYRNEHQYAR